MFFNKIYGLDISFKLWKMHKNDYFLKYLRLHYYYLIKFSLWFVNAIISCTICFKFISVYIVLFDVGSFIEIDFQDPASGSMEGIIIFNLHLLMIIVSIVLIVGWLLTTILKNFSEWERSISDTFVHSSSIEIVWTSLPALILLSLASPSFTLLYSLDELSIPDLTLKTTGHQWFWTYEIFDYFDGCTHQGFYSFKYSSYMLTNEILKENNGFFRLLETSKRIVLPSNTHLRVIITAVDVLHSWAIPSFGIKVDACPGRLNLSNLYLKRIGLFFGQCSEICGVNHAFMPISVISIPSHAYNLHIFRELEIDQWFDLDSPTWWLYIAHREDLTVDHLYAHVEEHIKKYGI